MKQNKLSPFPFCLSFILLFLAVTVSARETAYPVEIHVMTLEQRDLFSRQEIYPVMVGIAYLAKNNAEGTNGTICAPFHVNSGMTQMAFVLTNAPGAVDYNIQLYAGQPGNGIRVSDYAVVDINNGVYFSGLIAEQDYYLQISSTTLITDSCTALYEMVVEPRE